MHNLEYIVSEVLTVTHFIAKLGKLSFVLVMPHIQQYYHCSYLDFIML